MTPIVTADEVGDPAAGLRILTYVNGETMQDGNTADMIFSVGEILASLSETMTLHPGDAAAFHPEGETGASPLRLAGFSAASILRPTR